MFRFHDTTRRALAHAVFVLLCLLPTFATICWAYHYHTPAHRHDLASQLSEQTGWVASCQRVTHPWSDTVRYFDLELRHHETNHLLAIFPQLDVVIRDQETLLIADHLELTNSGWQQLQATLTSRLQSAGQQKRPWRLNLGQLHLVDESRRLQCAMYRITAQEQQQTQGRAITANLRWQPEEPLPTEIRWQRQTESNGPLQAETSLANGGEIRTGSSSVPGALFVSGNGPQWLNSAAFHGRLRWIETPLGIQAEAHGELLNVDLQSALGDPLAQRWTGRARLTMAPLHIRDGRIVNWQGQLQAGPGEIGHELLLALQSLGCKPSDQSLTLNRATQAFDQLALQLDWSAEQVRLRGNCPEQPSGTIMAWNQRPLLLEPTGSIGPPSSLLNALAPVQTPRVPALPSLANWLRWIPTAPALPMNTARSPASVTVQTDRR